MKKIYRHSGAVAQLAIALICAVVLHGQQPTDSLADARGLLAQGQFAKSEDLLRAYLGSHSASAEAHFLLGYVLFREKRAKDSLAEYTAGAALHRPSADEFKTVASDYVLLGDFVDADRWFTEVTSETPLDAETWYLLGRTKYNEGLYEQGIASFEHVLAQRPKDVEAENNLGLCRRELNQLAPARTAFQTAIEWEGEKPTDAQPFLNLGTLDADAGDWENAIVHLAKAVELSPENPKIREELGAAYQEHNELAKAQGELEQAVALAPKSSEAHFKLAGLYRKEGKQELAKQEFDICAKLNSTHSSSETPNSYLPEPPKPH